MSRPTNELLTSTDTTRSTGLVAFVGRSGATDHSRPVVQDAESVAVELLGPLLGLVAAREKARVQLQAAVQRLSDAGLLGTKPVPDAAREINAMWEGLANAELRGEVLRIMPKREEQRAWLDALTTVVRGFASTPRHRRVVAAVVETDDHLATSET